ncbi:helix-turn-helix transcriptional regulator [Leisingera sp. M523]|uniref:helix-turn-helix domain-containing protein n=1 Tax=Leisingera sp. M523 TaxID=2867013 RepID=UPI0021A499F6|nr:helix-turn-helix domain-containing protein [Leisingera sp. M523]
MKLTKRQIDNASCDEGKPLFLWDGSLTQAALAERLGTVQSFVAKSESGERRMDVVEFVWWADATTGVDPFCEILTKMTES